MQNADVPELSWAALAKAWQARDAEALAFMALAAAFGCAAFSIVLAQAAAAVCLALLLGGLISRRVGWRWPMEAWFALAFAIVAVSSIWGGIDPQRVWAKSGKLLWFLFIPAVAMLVRGPGRGRTLVLAFIAGCTVRGLETCIWNPFRAWLHPTPDFLTALIDRGSMTDGQVLMVGAAITVALLIRESAGGRRRHFWLAVALVCEVAGLVVNFKRGSWFCAVLLIAGVVLCQARWKTWLVLAGALVLLVCLPPVRVRLAHLDREFSAASGGRLAMWTRVTPALVAAYPRGVGYGSLTNDLMRQAYRRVERGRNHLHANWAQVLVETGWLGLSIYGAWMLWLVGAAVANLRSARARRGPPPESALAALLVVSGLFLNGLVEYNFGDTELIMVLAIVAGLIAAQRGLCRSPSSSVAS